MGCTSLSSWFHRSWTHRSWVHRSWVHLFWTQLFWARRGRHDDGGRTRIVAAGGSRPRVHAAILLAIAATLTVVGMGLACIDQANAAPMCPGPTTADGLGCCAPGSTPNGDDTCQLGGGGVAASCALSQLTDSGTCCPASSSPQPDGTCQPAGGFASAPGCPLGQLGKSGLSCCPTGQVPQPDGTCQASTAQQPTTFSFGVSPCPAGLAFYQPYPTAPRYCAGPPTGCPAGLQLENPAGPVFGCCPPGAQQMQVEGSFVCTEPTYDNNGNVVQATVPSVAPTCPPGSTSAPLLAPGFFYCTAPTSCPQRYVLSIPDGLCVLGDTFGANPRTLPSSTPPPGPAPPAPLPGVIQLPVTPPTAVTVTCSPGYALNPDGSMCVLQSTVCAAGEVLTAGTCVTPKPPPREQPCPSGKQPGPGGTCVCSPQREPCEKGQVQGPDCNCIRAPTCPAGDIVLNGTCMPLRLPQLPVSVKTQVPCPAGKVRNSDGICVNRPNTTAQCPDGEVRVGRSCKKPSSSTTARPTTTIKSPRLNITTPKLTLSPKPSTPLRTPVKTPVRTPVKTPAKTTS